MKRLFTTLGTVFAFLGLATFTIFLIMSPNQSVTGTGTSLTADIAANFSGNDGTAVASTSADTADAPDATVPNDQTTNTVTSTDTTVTTTTNDDAVTSAAATGTPVATPAAQDTATPDTASPTSTDIQAAPELPIATATITVTPTAPTPPSLLLPSGQAAAPTDLSLPYNESNFAGDHRWQTTWGAMQITGPGYIDLSAGPDSFGGAIYLENGDSWQNYSMTATLDLAGGNTFDLIANYIDASNYAFCEYSKTDADTISMQFGQYIKGYKMMLSPVVPVSLSGGENTDLNASITVKDNNGSCSLNGKTVSNEGIGPGKTAMASGAGSIGFAINDSAANTAHIVVKSVNVMQE